MRENCEEKIERYKVKELRNVKNQIDRDRRRETDECCRESINLRSASTYLRESQ